MKHSPFAFFRKHQRVGMVIMTATAMFAFVFLDQTMRNTGAYGGRANEVAVSIKGGNLSYSQLENLKQTRMIANRFLAAMAAELEAEGTNDPQARLLANSVMQSAFGREYPAFGDTEEAQLEFSVMWGHLMRLEAKRLGMVVNDSAVTSYINRLSAQRLGVEEFQSIFRKSGTKEKFVYDAFREELLAKMAFKAVFPHFGHTPEQYWEYYKRLKVTQNLEIAALPVKEFTKSLKEPSNRELETFFNENKTRFNESPPDYWKPGFRQPKKVRLQYLTGTYTAIESRVQGGKDKYAKPVTDKDIVDYYEAKKDPNYVDIDLEEPKKPEGKAGEAKKDGDPLNPAIAPDKSATPGAAKPEATGDKPATPPASKPAEEKPASEKPAETKPAGDKPEEGKKPAEEKAAEKAPEKPADKPAEEKPAETKPEETAEKKPCGDDPATDKSAEEKKSDAAQPEKKSDEKKPEDKSAEKPAETPAKPEPAKEPAGETKPADEKPAAEKPAGDKPAEEKPASEKPAGDKPAGDKAPAGDKTADPAAKAEEAAKFKPKKFKPLTDALKEEIRDQLERDRTLESINKTAEEAKTLLEEQQLKFSYGATIIGKTVFLDFDENGKWDESEPGVETEKELNPEDANRLPLLVQTQLDAKVYELSAEAMKKVGDKLGLEFHQTELLSEKDFRDDPRLGKLTDLGSNPFQGDESDRVRTDLFASISKFQPKTAKDPETNLFVFWKVEHVQEHIAKFTDPGIKEQVLERWKLLQAFSDAQKRAEELVKQVEGQKTLVDSLKGVTVTGEKDGLALEVHETGDFAWMSTSGLPTPQMFGGGQQLMQTEVTWTKDIDDEFMEAACEDLKIGQVGFAPNRTHEVIYVIRIIHRSAANETDFADLHKKFMAEELFEMPLPPEFARFNFGMPPQPSNYLRIANSVNQRLAYDWIESMIAQYKVKWTDEMRNYGQ